MLRLWQQAAEHARRVASWLTWPNITKALGVTIVLSELWQVHQGHATDQGLLLLAAGLLGLGAALKRNGNGSG